jgi:hypothetical protein
VTTSYEDRLRAALRDTADEAQPVEFLPRLSGQPSTAPHRRRVAVAAVAAAVAALVALGSVLLLRSDRSSIIEPVERPPKVFRLSGDASLAPGRAQIAVLTTRGTAHVHPVGGGPAVRLAPTDWVSGAYTQSLAMDGTRVIRQSYDWQLEIVDLSSGQTNRLGGFLGFCPQLSPDSRTILVIHSRTRRLTFLDARSGERLPGGRAPLGDGEGCPRIAWSPDGKLIVVSHQGETLLLDGRGRTVRRLPDDRSPVNGHMSWAPDGQSILTYHQPSGRFVVASVDGEPESVLEAPRDVSRPLGWAGTRIVWLVGPPGNQRLVTTDRTGADPQPWMRLEIGDRSVESVQWSRELTGWAADSGP